MGTDGGGADDIHRLWPMRVDDERELGAELRRVVPPDVRSGARRIRATDVAALLPVERRHVERAVPTRRWEFATGRVLLRSLIGSGEAITVLPSRAPKLPRGLVGSLSHDDRFAVAVVADRNSVAAIGVDIEPCIMVSDDTRAVLLHPDDIPIDPIAALSVKEAVFKA